MIELAQRTVVNVLQTGEAEHPDQRAVVDATGHVTYRGLLERSLRAAAGLRALGVGPGDRVALLLDNSIDHVVAWFGCLCLRAVEVAVNTALMAPQLAYVVDHCEARVVACAARTERGRDLRRTNVCR
jgi:long-chain acyl-CoA synthetase